MKKLGIILFHSVFLALSIISFPENIRKRDTGHKPHEKDCGQFLSTVASHLNVITVFLRIQ